MNWPLPEDIVMPGEEREGWFWCESCQGWYPPDSVHALTQNWGGK